MRLPRVPTQVSGDSRPVPPGLAADDPRFEDELRRRADGLATEADPGLDWKSVQAMMRAARQKR